MTTLSVIMPVYNVEKYVSQAIESVLNQPCKDLELIIVDDGSLDNSGKICDEYALKDSRVKVIHKENEGVSVARNVGIEKAGGMFVAFLDSDDVWTDNFYDSELCDLLKAQEYDFYAFKYYFVKEDLTAYKYPSGKSNYSGELKTTNKFMFNMCSFIVNLAHIKSVQIPFAPKCKYYEDVVFESNAMHNKKVAFFDKTMHLYRYNPSSVSHSGLNNEQMYFPVISARIWYADFYKDKNHSLYKMNYACIFGSVYEYLIASFLAGATVKHVEDCLVDGGFEEYYYNYSTLSLTGDMKKKLDDYFKNKQLFRFKWRIRGLLRKILRRS